MFLVLKFMGVFLVVHFLFVFEWFLSRVFSSVFGSSKKTNPRKVALPDSLFEGFRDVGTVTSWLSIYEDDRDNRAIAQDLFLSSFWCQHPSVWLSRQLRQAWPPETLLLGLQSSIGWMERPDTRTTCKAGGFGDGR